MNKLVIGIATMLLALSAATQVSAADTTTQNQSACGNDGIIIGFFNGVNTIEKDADISTEYLQRKYGGLAKGGETIRFENFFNKTEGFNDFVEVFDQRMQENNGILAGRFDLFWDSLKGGGGWWDLITGQSPSLGGLRDSINDAFSTRVVQLLANAVSSNPPSTMLTEVEHRARIDTAAIEGKRMLFVAHSQGNLFANKAYAYATTKVPKESVKVVHAAPASPTLSGEYVLADLDVVIMLLGKTGAVPNHNAEIPPYIARTPGVNGERDILGHGFLEIYMHPGMETGTKMNAAITSAMDQLVAPPVQVKSGFFTATLTWDGVGDVDLHTTVPDGSQVFYAHPLSRTGYLDMDNVTGYGPEHYYASCNPENLQEGTYRISLANYARAEGRLATVQIISNVDGVLGTKRIVMGAETGNIPSAHVFDVQVRRDGQSGRLRAFLTS